MGFVIPKTTTDVPFDYNDSHAVVACRSAYNRLARQEISYLSWYNLIESSCAMCVYLLLMLW